MLYKLGRFLQLVGLVVMPVGIAGNMARPEEVGVKAELTIAGAGLVVFVIGWLLQQSARPQLLQQGVRPR